jgi:hypothetical protein
VVEKMAHTDISSNTNEIINYHIIKVGPVTNFKRSRYLRLDNNKKLVFLVAFKEFLCEADTTNATKYLSSALRILKTSEAQIK